MNQLAHLEDLKKDMDVITFNAYQKGYLASKRDINPFTKSRGHRYYAWNAGYIDRHTLNKETK